MNTKKNIHVDLSERSYDIAVSPGILKNAGNLLKNFVAGKKCLIITDSNVNELYAKNALAFLKNAGAEASLTDFPAGEASKHLGTVGALYSKAVGCGLDRNSLIVALGGGVPGDIAGFVAATYMRGVNFIQIPTSLLAMVDSSVGGKTGVDLPEGKNLVGAFWQPLHVLIDPEVLKTLPEREVKCGLAEIIKYGVIVDEELFEMLENNIDKLNSLDLDFYSEVIARCCRLKAQVVSQDEREGGLRAILNFGHTFGHAVEAVSGYQTIGHGEGVAIGMCMASDLAAKSGRMDKNAAMRLEQLLKTLGLPCGITGHKAESILEAMSSDKKKKDGKLVLILPDKIGAVSIVNDTSRNDILTAIKGRCH